MKTKKLKRYYKVTTASTKDGFDPEYNQYCVTAWSPELAIRKVRSKISFEKDEEINSVEFLGIPFQELLEK